MAKKKELTVEEKLRALYNLQLIDSRVDEIRNVRGELPLEVRDLEDEVEGFKLRYQKLEDNLNEIDNQIKSKKNLIEEAKVLIKKYNEQQKNVRIFDPMCNRYISPEDNISVVRRGLRTKPLSFSEEI